MQISNTTEAFLKMLEEKNVNKILEVDRSTISNWKKSALEKKGISKDKMEEMLLKFGATLVTPPTWYLPIHKLSAQEIRIGNIVLLEETNDPYPVSVTGRIIKDLEDDKLKVSGIRLSAEIIQNIGFKCIQPNLYYFKPLHLQNEERGWFHVLGYGYVSLSPVLYLHELQNLYFASNKLEIQIDLNLISRNLFSSE